MQPESTLEPGRERSALAPRFRSGYRADLQGLRAIAVLLVLGYHAGLPFLSGGYVGVDVFFVLSGFLITGIVARELEQAGALSLRRFYARRITRIVPAATVVLLFTAATTLLFLPITQWRRVAEEIIGSAVYISNWQFAASTDYLNAEAAASPLQHFWSLAVEEQYYLLWPALLAITLAVGRLLRKRGRSSPSPVSSAVWLMAAIAASSFVVSIVATASRPEAAYFITPTRLWELGVGSLLALAAPALGRLPRSARACLSGAGMIAVLGSGSFFTNETPFPGAAALLPVLGAAALITAGLPGRGSPQRHVLMSSPVLVWFGGISYSLYLWHWPLLVIAASIGGELSVFGGVAVVVFSILPAYLSTRFIENPLRTRWGMRSHSRRAFVLGAVCIALSIAAAGAVLATLHASSAATAVRGHSAIGAASIAEGEAPPPATRVPRQLTPSLVVAHDDNPAIYPDGCHLEVSATEPVECAYGNADGPLILLTGDSHAAQWFPALEELAKANGLRLVSMTKSSCPFADVEIELEKQSRPYSECSEWNRNVREYIETSQPAAVFTSTLGAYSTAEPAARLAEGLRSSWSWTADQGIAVIALADTPYMGANVPDCLASHIDAPQECASPRSEVYPHQGLEARAAADVEGVHVLDLNDKICPGAICEPIIGDVLVYRDQHHLSATYSRTLAPALVERTAPLLPSIG